MFIPSTFKRPVSSWKALNLRKTLLMASSVRLKPLNCSRLPCVYAQETLTFLLTQKKTCVKNYVLTSFSHSTRNKTRDGLIRVRNIRALNGRFNTSITHAYSIVIGSKHITLNATGGGFLTASKQFRHGATSKSRSNTAS